MLARDSETSSPKRTPLHALHLARVGKMVLVAAEAGYGKSSLIERFTLEHRRDTRALWGACDSLATLAAGSNRVEHWRLSRRAAINELRPANARRDNATRQARRCR